jgi:hypothetical protein
MLANGSTFITHPPVSVSWGVKFPMSCHEPQGLGIAWVTWVGVLVPKARHEP